MYSHCKPNCTDNLIFFLFLSRFLVKANNIQYSNILEFLLLVTCFLLVKLFTEQSGLLGITEISASLRT